MYLSRSSVLDFVGILRPLTLRNVPLTLKGVGVTEGVGDTVWFPPPRGTGLKTRGVAMGGSWPHLDTVVRGGGDMGGE